MRVVVRAPAKLNLGLEILGRRSDDYHEIRTILANISLYDHVSVEEADESELCVDVPDLNTDTNLVALASRLLERDFPSAVARFDLRKRIPAAAGLGGASSDAAATLVALNHLRSLGLSNTQLETYGAQIGSDVPFFVEGGYALASGRGDQLSRFPAPSPVYAVLVCPRIAIPRKTKTLYDALRPSDFSDGVRTELSAKSYRWLEDESSLANAFERPLYDLVPSLGEVRSIMRRLGAWRVGLSGAGPSHYALDDDDERSKALAERLREFFGSDADVFVCDLIATGVTQIESNRQFPSL
jgi:4-diphosphocytidyl-2-C-methyl-D-erythritol kinase